MPILRENMHTVCDIPVSEFGDDILSLYKHKIPKLDTTEMPRVDESAMTGTGSTMNECFEEEWWLE